MGKLVSNMSTARSTVVTKTVAKKTTTKRPLRTKAAAKKRTKKALQLAKIKGKYAPSAPTGRYGHA